MKKIFITQRVEVIESYNEIRDCLDEKWIELLLECKLLPVLVQNNLDYVKCIINEIKPDGILLTGGNNLYKYGGNAKIRDEVEVYLINYAISNQIPVLGVCRGMQVILDYFNCILSRINGHVNTTHTIKSVKGEEKVNSYHNFGVFEVGNDINIISKADDGVVEQIKHKEYNIYGIMHHPERYSSFRKDDLKFIKSIFE